MPEPQTVSPQGFLVPDDQALIGLSFDECGYGSTRYFVDEAAADAAVDGATEQALQLTGAWGDLGWEEIAEALDRIRHQSPPSSPIRTSSAFLA